METQNSLNDNDTLDESTDVDIFDEGYVEAENAVSKLYELFQSDIARLLEISHSPERTEQVIFRVRTYAQKSAKIYGYEGKSYSDRYLECVKDELLKILPALLSDEHCKIIVRCHAQGLSTTESVFELAETDPCVNLLSQQSAIGWETLREKLVKKYSYLRPGNARWPQKKYGQVWDDARAAYKEHIQDIPMSSTVEQIQVFIKDIERIEDALTRVTDYKDLCLLLKTRKDLILSLNKLTLSEPDSVSGEISSPQLLAILERCTVALSSPQPMSLSSDMDKLVTVVEQLLVAFKNGVNLKAIEMDTNEVRETEVVSVETSASVS